MTLGENDIREFAELWQAEFGDPISLDNARASASALLDLYTLLAQSPKGSGTKRSAKPFS